MKIKCSNAVYARHAISIEKLIDSMYAAQEHEINNKAPAIVNYVPNNCGIWKGGC